MTNWLCKVMGLMNHWGVCEYSFVELLFALSFWFWGVVFVGIFIFSPIFFVVAMINSARGKQ